GIIIDSSAFVKSLQLKFGLNFWILLPFSSFTLFLLGFLGDYLLFIGVFSVFVFKEKIKERFKSFL
ncbi:hypothetical protein, partial [Arcobacter sp. s6]|uniref:hypothetical protein n=1 Tax=Arcobacter sp. s6 TaxID=3230363 RepID=UPI0034A00C82